MTPRKQDLKSLCERVRGRADKLEETYLFYRRENCPQHLVERIRRDFTDLRVLVAEVRDGHECAFNPAAQPDPRRGPYTGGRDHQEGNCGGATKCKWCAQAAAQPYPTDAEALARELREACQNCPVLDGCCGKCLTCRAAAMLRELVESLEFVRNLRRVDNQRAEKAEAKLDKAMEALRQVRDGGCDADAVIREIMSNPCCRNDQVEGVSYEDYNAKYGRDSLLCGAAIARAAIKEIEG